MVREFHEATDTPILDRPGVPEESRVNLRVSLLAEEFQEAFDAMENEDLVEVADGLADLIYVAIGAALEFGIPLDEVFEEVHRTNMEKANGPRRSDGKILKPEGWEPPDVAGILLSAGMGDRA